MNVSLSSTAPPRDGAEQLEGWSLYFPEDEFSEQDPKCEIAKILTDFFLANAHYLNADEARAKNRCSFNYQHLKLDIPVADFEAVLRCTLIILFY